MSGHSKWANIRFRKVAQDAKRGKIFTKLINEITASARLSSGDANTNPRLRAAVDKALGANMTRDTIDRAIKRGYGELNGEDIVEIRYEGYGPSGVAIMVECATDNKNRTVSEIRHAFAKYGGHLGTDRSVTYLFNKVGSIIFSDMEDEEKIMDIALEAGAEDIKLDDDMIEVVTTPENLHQVEQAFKEIGLQPDISELIQRPITETELSGEEAEKVMKLIEELEDLDDVRDVFTNASFIESA